MNISELTGKVIANIEVNADNDEIKITCESGEIYLMHHIQDCCESVMINDICGDLADLLNSPILQAEESTSDLNPDEAPLDYQDSFTWTFYKLATIKGYVTIRWYGESNGYYSESVDFDLINNT